MEIYKPQSEVEPHRELSSSIEILKKRFPDIGIDCSEMPIKEAIEVFNTKEPPFMQFKPKTPEDMEELTVGLNETDGRASVHLPDLEFDEETGMLRRKQEMIEMLKQEGSDNIKLITVHLGWDNAELVLDKHGNWENTKLANKVLNELVDLLIAGIQSGKMMVIENVRYKPSKYDIRERFGSRPEHLIVARNKLAQTISKKIDIPVDEVLSKIGYAFDVGHAVGNAHLSEEYPIEAWLEELDENIKIMHIHDMRPMKKDGVVTQKTHLPLGTGKINWKNFFKSKAKHCLNTPMILELDEDKTIESVDYLSILSK